MGSEDEPLPGVLDWVVTLCEFVSCFAIVTSFFQLAHPADASADEWFSRDFLVKSASKIWAGCLFFVLLPRVGDCVCGWRMRLLHHPRFPAAMQVWKLVIFGSNFYGLSVMLDADGKRMYKLKASDELAASILLALCDFLGSFNTVASTFCGKDLEYTMRRNNNPRPRRSRAWIFVNLWKDFGILSTLINVEELYILIFEIPATISCTKGVIAAEMTSQDFGYHVVRTALVASCALGYYLGSLVPSTTTSFTLVQDKTAAVILISCEVLLIGCELINGRRQRAEQQQQPVTTPLERV